MPDPLIVGAGLAAGSTAAGLYSNSQNRSLTREGWAAQRFMRQKAYQDTVIDLRKAGLNPILAYTKGATHTPSMMNAIPMQNPAAGASSAFSHASSAYQTQSNIEKQGAEIEKISQEIQNLQAGKELTEAQTKQVASVIQKLEAEVSNIQANNKHLDADLIRKQVLADFYEQYPEGAVAREFGVDAKLFTNILGNVFGRSNRRYGRPELRDD